MKYKYIKLLDVYTSTHIFHINKILLCAYVCALVF